MYRDDYDLMKGIYISLKNRLLCKPKNNSTPPFSSSTNMITPPNDHQKSNTQLTNYGGIFNSEETSNFPSKIPKPFINNPVEGQTIDISPLANNIEDLGKDSASREPKLVPFDLKYELFSNDQFYNTSTIELCYALDATTILCSIQFDSTGERYAFADGKTIFLIQTIDGSIIASIPIPNDHSYDQKHTRELCFSPDDKFILISGSNNSIIIFSIESQSVVGVLEGHTNIVTSLVFLPNSFHLLSGGLDGSLCLWDYNQKTLIKKIQHGETNDSKTGKEMITSIALSNDHSFIAVGFMSGSVGIYEPTLTQPMNVFKAHHDAYVIHVSSANHSPILATSSNDNTIKIWVMRSIASCKQTLTDHSNCVITSCFSNDDSILFSGSKDETIKAWDYKKGELLFTIKPHGNTVFDICHHPTENMFVFCMGDGVVCLWKYVAKSS